MSVLVGMFGVKTDAGTAVTLERIGEASSPAFCDEWAARWLSDHPAGMVFSFVDGFHPRLELMQAMIARGDNIVLAWNAAIQRIYARQGDEVIVKDRT